MKQEDLNLIERCRRGEQAAFTALVRKYQDPVYNLCRRILRNPDDARDQAQEAFVRTFRNLDRYDPAYAFSAWLLRITANLCIDHLRRQRMRMCSLDEPIETSESIIPRQLIDPAARPDEAVENGAIRAAIRAAIDRLPVHYRIILLMRHDEQLSYEEIATTLDIPLGTVKARIHRAREGLKTLLQAWEPEGLASPEASPAPATRTGPRA